MISIMEAYGKWSRDMDYDDKGSYEDYPFCSALINDVGLHAHWLYFLSKAITPIRETFLRDYSEVYR
jgi:hypothetical protein